MGARIPGSSGPAEAGPPRLLELLRREIQLRHYSARTEEAYTHWVRQFILFHGKRHPREMRTVEIGGFPSHLAVSARVAAATQDQALNAIVFLYSRIPRREMPEPPEFARARRPERLPVVLTREELRALLARLEGTLGLVSSLLYGSGLRLRECLELRVKDLDFGSGEIRVRDGKGRKDRVTPLPRSSSDPLRAHLGRVRKLHEQDLAYGFGAVALPDALARKYPNAPREMGLAVGLPGGSPLSRARQPERAAPSRVRDGGPARYQARRTRGSDR